MKITLKAMRTNRRLKMKPVAKAMGVSVPTLCIWERLPCHMSVRKAKELCEYYGYDLGDLDIGEENEVCKA